MFKLMLPVNEMMAYVVNQLNNIFPDCRFSQSERRFIQSFDHAIQRSEYCFKHVTIKAFHNEGVTYFSHLHSDQYALFLWFLSNSVWKEFEDIQLAAKIFYLNKLLNGVICMYDAKMPDIFLILHGGGVVLGKATYSDFFVCYHGCTVGAVNGIYPVFNKGVVMAPHSSVIGNCIIGENSTIGNQALLRNQSLDSGVLYYRDINNGHHVTKRSDKPWAQSFFNVPI